MAVAIRVFRPGDWAAVARIVNEANLAGAFTYQTQAQLRAHFVAMDADFQPQRDLFLAVRAQIPVGLVGLFGWSGRARVNGWVRPLYQRQGIGGQLVAHLLAEAQLRGVEELETPRIPAERQAVVRFLERCGFVPERRWCRLRLAPLRTIPEPRLPPGVVLDLYRDGADDEEWVAVTNAAFSTNPGFAPFTRQTVQALREQRLHDPQGTILARLGGRVVGTVTAGVERTGGQRGYISTLGVDPAYRGLGLGRGLLLAALHNLRERGMTAAELDVDDRNLVALRLYQDVGFVLERRRVIYTLALHGHHGSNGKSE